MGGGGGGGGVSFCVSMQLSAVSILHAAAVIDSFCASEKRAACSIMSQTQKNQSRMASGMAMAVELKLTCDVMKFFYYFWNRMQQGGRERKSNGRDLGNAGEDCKLVECTH